MKVVIQRVLSAHVKVKGETIGEIGKGYLLYVCFEKEDKLSVLDKAVKKILALRIFEDDAEKMNLNISQVSGEILSISQFTLSWDGVKGNRPSFDLSMPPRQAEEFYLEFNKKLQENSSVKIKNGAFGADMKVESINDGPVTFHLSF